MATENIFEPNINLIKKDEYYLFYEMMMHSLKTDSVKEGINKSLFLLKEYTSADHISVYTKNDDGVYVFKASDTPRFKLIRNVKKYCYFIFTY